jgi:CelD/BcsL family acetyltransferase involved in cellulose biosynthesis
MRDVEVYTTREQLTDLAPFWDGLDTFLNAPFGQYRWILSCVETLAADSQLFMPVIRKGETPVAMAPLVRPHRFLAVARHLEDHGEPGDFNYKDIESLDLLAKALAENHVPLELARTAADSPTLAALRRAYRRRGFVVLRPAPNCPFIEIEATEDQTSARLPARLRGDLRRASRKAKQIGVVSVETHVPATEGDLLPLWEEALKVEAAGWKGRSRSALQMDHRVGPFYRSYAARACEQGILRILFLKLGPDIASMMIALEASERFWILKIGYDERFAKCSPGMLLMHEALRYAARRGLRSYEFLGSATDWTRRWTDRGRPIHRVLVFPYTVQGTAILVRHTAGYLWRKVCLRLKGG